MLNPKGNAPPPVVQKPVPVGPGANVGAAPHNFAPLPKPPIKGLIPLGMNINIDKVNDTVAKVTQNHRTLFGTNPHPGLVFDVVRGVGQGIVKDVDHLFQIPHSQREARLRPTAIETPPQHKPLLTTDPGAAKAIEDAQGHPLTPEQKVALGQAQGKISPIQARARLQQAGVLPKLQIVHDEGDIFNQIAAGGFLFATGLIASPVVIGLSEGAAAVRAVKQRSLRPIVKTNEQIAKGVAVKTFDDTRAILTGNMAYLKENPDAYWNVGFLFLGGAHGLSRISGVAAVTKQAGFRAGLMETVLPTPPPSKVMTYHGATVDALNYTNPIVRFADNLRTDRMQARSEGRAKTFNSKIEPLPAVVMRAIRIPAAADFISKHFSYEAKFRRESEALMRSKYEMGVYLARKLDDITAASIDAGSALEDVPKPTKNSLTIGELKAIHVIAQGGDWMESITTMRNAYKRWRDVALVAGALEIARDNTAQLAALKLAEETLRKGFDEGFSKTFNKALPLIQQALEFSTTLKIDKLGLAPETADLRNFLEYDIYREQRALPNRKKIAGLIRSTEVHIADLEKKKGFVPPSLHLAHEKALEEMNSGLPAIPEGHVRLYRGEGEGYMSYEDQGLIPGDETHYFSSSRETASSFESGGGVYYVDVPRNVAKEHASGAGNFELPGTIASNMKLVEGYDTLDKVSPEKIGQLQAEYVNIFGEDALTNPIAKHGEPDFGDWAMHQMYGEGYAKARKAVASAKKKIEKAENEAHPQLAGARKRMESLKVTLAEAEARVGGAERREGAFRLPLVGRTRDVGGSLPPDFIPPRKNRLGEGPPSVPAEITHSFTGRGVIAGDTRLDFTNLVARELAKTVRAAMWTDDYHVKFSVSVDVVPEGVTAKFYAPIRKDENINPKVRKIVANIREGTVSTEDFASLSSEEVDALNEVAYPTMNKEGVWVDKDEHPVNLKNYKWYDSRAFPVARSLENGPLQKGFSNFYNMVGRPRIFLAPRYALNYFSNAGMMALADHVMTPVAVAAGHFAKKIYDPETVDRVDVAMSGSRSESFGPTTKGQGPINKSMSAITHFWHFATDTHLRRGQFFYRAWQHGYTSAEKMSDLVKKPENIEDFNKIKRMAQKDMVELGNMTWSEQQYLRHIIFVYPWRSRQALWSVRTLAEHPASSAILSMIGQNALEDELDNKPHWIQEAIKHYLNIGYTITSWNPDGSPKGMGIGQLNTFSGLLDVMMGVGPSEFNPDSLGPGLEFFYEAVKGRDQFGRDFAHKGSARQVLDAFLNVAIESQPLTLAYQRGGKAAKQPALPPFDPANRETLLNRLNAAQRQVGLSPGWLNGYGLWFSGGLTPRTINKEKLLYTYYHGLDDAERHKFEQNLIHNVLNVQSHLLGRPIPQGVNTAIDVTSQWSYNLNVLSKKLGMNDGVPDMMKDEALMQVMINRGLVDNKTAKKELGALQSIKGLQEKDHKEIRSEWMVRYAGGAELHQWDADIRTVASFGTGALEKKAARLRDMGLSRIPTPPASQKTLYELGQKVVQYEAKVRDLQTKIKGEADPVESAKLKSQMVDLLVAGDQLTKIAGTILPSVARLSIADMSDKERRDHLVSSAGQSWTSLSSIDKEMLTGRPVDPIVDQAWAAIKQRMAEEKAALKPGQSLPTGLKAYYVNKVAKQSPAFAADLRFAAQPLAQKLSTYSVIKKSAYSDDWDTLLSTAKLFVQQRIDAGWKKSSGKPDWSAIKKDWVAREEKLHEVLATQTSSGFRQELKMYEASHKNFIADLVNP